MTSALPLQYSLPAACCSPAAQTRLAVKRFPTCPGSRYRRLVSVSAQSSEASSGGVEQAVSDAVEGAVEGARDTASDTLAALDALLQSAQSAPQSLTQPAVPVSSTSAPEAAPNASTSGRQLDARAAEPVDKGLVKLALDFAIGWVKDNVKPSTLVEEDANLPRVKPRLSYLLLALNLAVYGVGLSFNFIEGMNGSTDYFLRLAKVNNAVEGGEYYRLLSANFLHDSFIHLALSSYALLTLAPEAEAVLGYFAFAMAFVLGGTAGTVTCFLLSDTLTVGASSGIFGMIGALGAYLYKNHKTPKSSDQNIGVFLGLAFNLILGSKDETAVDNIGHLGGLLAGIYLGFLLTPKVVEEATAASDASQQADVDGSDDPSMLKECSVETSQDDRLDAHARLQRPNALQSAVVLVSFIVTLSTAVSAAVLERTGEVPFPNFASFLEVFELLGLPLAF